MLGSGVLHGKVAEHLVRGKVDRPRCLRVYNTAVSPSQRAQVCENACSCFNDLHMLVNHPRTHP